MRLSNYLVYRPSGFAFRLVVPVDLRSIVGSHVIKRALRTHDRTVAQAFALALAGQYAQVFRDLRGESVMAKDGIPTVADILGSFKQGKSRTYEIDLSRGIARSEGPEDHARMLEALDRLERVRPQALPVAPKPVTPKGITLEKAIANYTDIEAPGLKADTWDGRQRALKTFVQAVGAKTAVNAITRQMAAEWSGNLVRAGASKRTAVNYVSNVAQVFAFLVQQGHLTDNPVKGVMVMKQRDKSQRKADGHEWEAFDLTQLKAIFAPAHLAKMTKVHQRWATVLGLYSGARVGEIAQIFLRDIVEEQGIWCIRLTVESDGQSIKTEGSKRLVPLHPDILELGFLDYVQTRKNAGDERLFPEVNLNGNAGKGASVSSSFTYHLNRSGVEIKPRRQNGRIGFHSLRKTVIQALQGTAVSDERRRAFVGHEQADDVHTTSYMRPWTAEELSSLWVGLKWGEWLDIPALKEHLT
jgi:integrase